MCGGEGDKILVVDSLPLRVFGGDAMENGMRPDELLVRCYAKKADDQWVAVSLEFGLAAQADTLDEVKAKLDAQIRDYVAEALGEDREHSAYLLRRRAPVGDYVGYYVSCVLGWLRKKAGSSAANPKRQLFTETLHMQPS